MPSPSVWLTPFGGSCVTGEVCERTNRRWICIELPYRIKEGAATALEGEWGTLDPSVLGSNPRGPTTYFDSGIAEISSPAERGSCVLTAVLTATSMDFLRRCCQ